MRLETTEVQSSHLFWIMQSKSSAMFKTLITHRHMVKKYTITFFPQVFRLVPNIFLLIKTYSSGLGNFSIAGFEVRLKRHSMKYIIYNYFPSGLFVCLSWISFLIPVENVPGRIALLVTLLLALINMFNSSLQTQPNTKAITSSSIC